MDKIPHLRPSTICINLNVEAIIYDFFFSSYQFPCTNNKKSRLIYYIFPRLLIKYLIKHNIKLIIKFYSFTGYIIIKNYSTILYLFFKKIIFFYVMLILKSNLSHSYTCSTNKISSSNIIHVYLIFWHLKSLG